MAAWGPAATAPSTPSGLSLESYFFPRHRLRTELTDPTKTPLVLVGCGSFSPVTHMHLRMFEMAVDHVRQNMSDEYEVVGGYISPVSDRYNKAGLASARHRIRMCELACDQTSDWLMVDPWEAIQPDYQPTAIVLNHFRDEINKVQGGILAGEERKDAHIILLCGADLLMSMVPGVWSMTDLDHILLEYGLFVIERTGSSVSEALAQLKELNPEWVKNIQIIRQLIPNDISSTSIRQFLRLGLSVHYLLPWCVIEYIREHGLYMDDSKEKRSNSVPPISRKKAGEPASEAGQRGKIMVGTDGDAHDEKKGRELLHPDDAVKA